MKRIIFIIFLFFCANIIYTSCDKEEEIEDIESPFISGLTALNYPKIDGSTSTAPLNTIIACKLFGFDYKWIQSSHNGVWNVEPNFKWHADNFSDKIKSSQTHNSIINLIDKKADVILSARKMSPDEKKYADDMGVSLIETPIALDAFIFIAHPDNPIESLTTKQIQDIYTGKITDWKEVGLQHNVEIKPYVRNPYSGSQELMESLVMKDLEFMEYLPTSYEVVIFTMQGAFEFVSVEVNSICYTVYYYKEQMIRKEPFVKSISVNGIYPDKQTISNKTYPYVAEVYAVIRTDLDNSSMAYRLYEWLQTEEGKQVISESGYITD